MKQNNLAFGKPVTVATAFGQAAEVSARFTNGVVGEPDKHDTWSDFQNVVSVELTVDLGAAYAVDGFDMGFLHDRASGTYCPDEVCFYLSEDGRDFHLAEAVSSPYPASFSLKTRVRYKSSLEKSYRARFVRVTFGVERAVRCDELRVFGNALLGFEEPLSSVLYQKRNKNRFALRDSLGSACDIPVVSYAHMSEDGETSRLSCDDFIPLLAYVGEDGTVKDVMFDAVAICSSFVGNCPSGGCLTEQRDDLSVLSDWEWLIDELFSSGSNLKAFDEAAKFVKKALSLPRDHKFKIYLSAPVPKIGFSPFGDMNCDGIEEKLLTTEDCVSAFSWYVDAVVRRFEAECLANLAIEGFVWSERYITREKRDDAFSYASSCVSVLHERGYKCLFITDCRKGGCDRSDDIGFDCTAVEYEIGSNSSDDLCRSFGFAPLLKAGYGILNPQTKNESLADFYDKLIACVKNRMMTDTVHVYDHASVLAFCAASEDVDVRKVYDDVYLFTKGRFCCQYLGEPEPEKTEAFVIEEAAKPKSVFAEEIEPEPEHEAEITEDVISEIESSVQPELESELCQPELEAVESEVIETAEPEAVEPDDVDKSTDSSEICKKSDFEENARNSEITIKIEIEKQEEPLAAKEGEGVHKPNCCFEAEQRCPKAERCFRPEHKKQNRDNYKQLAYLGLGIAATLGVAYVITKITRGNK